MVVYLNAAMEKLAGEKGEKVHPAGMFYYHIEDPLLDFAEEGIPEQRLLKELAWTGLSSGDREIVALMDREIGTVSEILPLRQMRSNLNV